MSEDFWSRRKQAVEAEKRAGERAREEEKAAERREALAEKPDEEVLAELDLPDPDTLGEGDDFAAFMKQAVPDRLRRRALRRLWLSNPLLANLDELLEYGEDFTDAATVVADLQSVYQVGKGMVRDEDLEAAAEDPPAEDRAEDEAPAEAGVEEENAPEAEGGDTDAPEEPPAADEPPPQEEIEEPRGKRHMRFAFADDGAAGGRP